MGRPKRSAGARTFTVPRPTISLKPNRVVRVTIPSRQWDEVLKEVPGAAELPLQVTIIPVQPIQAPAGNPPEDRGQVRLTTGAGDISEEELLEEDDD